MSHSQLAECIANTQFFPEEDMKVMWTLTNKEGNCCIQYEITGIISAQWNFMWLLVKMEQY
jgi:hypothetical protein